jgi:uncharacterized protein involved in exopolysaccharide biosynthesis
MAEWQTQRQVVYVQKKISTAANVLKNKQTKLLEQRHQAEAATKGVPETQASIEELQVDLTAAEAELEHFQLSIRDEVCLLQMNVFVSWRRS